MTFFIPRMCCPIELWFFSQLKCVFLPCSSMYVTSLCVREVIILDWNISIDFQRTTVCGAGSSCFFQKPHSVGEFDSESSGRADGPSPRCSFGCLQTSGGNEPAQGGGSHPAPGTAVQLEQSLTWYLCHPMHRWSSVGVELWAHLWPITFPNLDGRMWSYWSRAGKGIIFLF